MVTGKGDRNKFDKQLTRRALLGWVGKGALVVAFGGTLSSLESNREFVRPPGALSEEEFLAICTRCQRCKEVCPYGAIRSVRLTESVLSAGTPVLEGYCWRGHCLLKCIASCPSGALQ